MEIATLVGIFVNAVRQVILAGGIAIPDDQVSWVYNTRVVPVVNRYAEITRLAAESKELSRALRPKNRPKYLQEAADSMRGDVEERRRSLGLYIEQRALLLNSLD